MKLLRVGSKRSPKRVLELSVYDRPLHLIKSNATWVPVGAVCIQLASHEMIADIETPMHASLRQAMILLDGMIFYVFEEWVTEVKPPRHRTVPTR